MIIHMREWQVSEYESVLIARQDISTAQVETLVDEFSKIIENMAEASRKENIGLSAAWLTGSKKEPEGPLYAQPRSWIL